MMETEVGGSVSIEGEALQAVETELGLGSWVSAAPSEGLEGAEGGSLRGEEGPAVFRGWTA